MFSKNFKKQALTMSAASVALTLAASSQAALTLMPNGDFSTGDLTDWDIFEAAPGDVNVEATGGPAGAGDAFGLVNNASGGWGGGFVQCGGALACSLADYGFSGGDTLNFQFDMKDFDGLFNGETAIKVESWSGATEGNFIVGSEIQTNYSSATNVAGWNTYTHSYVTDAAATHFKVVLVGTNSGQVGFDNLYIDSNLAPVPVPAAAWLFGSALTGLAAMRRRK